MYWRLNEAIHVATLRYNISYSLHAKHKMTDTIGQYLLNFNSDKCETDEMCDKSL